MSPIYDADVRSESDPESRNNLREAKMANDHWYVLRVRSGFQAVVAQKLRKLHLEVIIPDQKSISPQEPQLRDRSSTGYLYCRFDLENRVAVTSIPGVLDIAGTPEPAPLDGGWATMQTIRPH